MSTWRLFYDGGCNLCHVSQLRAERWAAKANQPLFVDVLASDEAIAKGYGDAMVLEADGQVLTAVGAWFKLIEVAPWYLRWLTIFNRFALGRAIFSWGYNIVAKYRYKWFGTRECQIPSKR